MQGIDPVREHALYKKIWNRLSRADRKTILLDRRVWREGSGIPDYECTLRWEKLLPITIGLDFSMILGKEVSPETE